MVTPDDTRSRLLLAAVRVLEAEGEVGIRVREIAAEAGVREPSIYHFFGSREGLIEAAQVHRFAEGQRDLTRDFDARVRQCSSRDEMVQAFRAMLRVAFRRRAAERAVRVNVLGSTQSRPSLAAQLAETQRVSGRMMADTLEFAQQRGWIAADLDPLAFSAWFVGQLTGRVLIEIDPGFVDANHWDAISTRAVFAVLGWDDPT